MRNPFDRLSEVSVERPKATLAVIVIGIFILSSFTRFIVFDNSEDAFFPANETTELLYEVEGQYGIDADLIRVIVRIDEGDLEDSDTWAMLATIEHDLIEFDGLSAHHLPLFGDAANTGPVSSVIFWQKTQDPLSDNWSLGVEAAFNQVLAAENYSELSNAVTTAITTLQTVPTPNSPNSDEILSWQPETPSEWQARIDSGMNNSERIGELISLSTGLMANRSADQIEIISPLQSASMATLIPLNEIQSIDLRSNMLNMFPNDSGDEVWKNTDAVLITLAVDTSSSLAPEDEVALIVKDYTIELEEQFQHTDDGISVFSFSRFSEEQTSTVGKEIGMLTSISLIVLGVILWWKFRSVRDTSIVLILTLLAIAATYGVSGILGMKFNAAMNSIPILLLAIGVDYGLHVVMRYREELVRIDDDDSTKRETMADFSADLRARAIKSGTILTSAALFVAIVTDMIGFLSFRLSSQNFLVVFGTVIAVGLFFIYLLSVTALPAMLRLLNAQKIPIHRSVQINEDRFSLWIGKQTKKPLRVVAVALLLSLPIAAGIQQLEIGFDTRDQLDDSIPVVSDFLFIEDSFGGQSSPTLYVVMDVHAISPEGRESYDTAIEEMNQETRISEISGLWDSMEIESTRNPELQYLLSNLSNDSSYQELENWLLNNETGRELSFRYLSADGQQSVISFLASTGDWKDTVDFVDNLSNSLSEHGEYRLSGRGLILAQISEDVAYAAVSSTAIVASVILLMLIAINLIRDENKPKAIIKGITMWIPLAVVVIWVYGLMGWTGYQLNSQTVTIGALTLGLGVDYSVHYVTRLDEEIEHNSTAGVSSWVSKTNSTTGRVMMGAALTTVGGFSVLNFSSLLPLRLFGQAFVIAILLALFSSIILLPALLNLFGLMPNPSDESEE